MTLEILVALNMAAFLNSCEQLTKAEKKENQAAVSVRIYFDQVIQCEKKFHQISNEILLILHG